MIFAALDRKMWIFEGLNRNLNQMNKKKTFIWIQATGPKATRGPACTVQLGPLAWANSAKHGSAGMAQNGTRPAHGARTAHGGPCGMAGGEPMVVETEDGLHHKLHWASVH
jgi:hypothetical protein